MKLYHVAFLVAVASIGLWGCAGVGTTNSGDAGAGDLAGGTAPPDLSTLPPDLAPRPDGAPPLLDVGSPCTMDSQCSSGACKSFDGGQTTTCVLTCTQQSDCAAYPTLYCEPSAVGSSSGYCLFHNPSHCETCAKDADCSGLVTRCIQAPNDKSLACHVDCSLSGAAACPNDYTCTAVADGATTRKLCLPNGSVCLDALGGFCDRNPSPQPCARTNPTGTCTGQRQCLGTGRYDICGASAPQYLESCGAQPPAGCTVAVDPTVLTTVANCGQCGNACGANSGCCNKQCTPLGSATNCSACGDACGAGSGCCSNACTSLSTVSNCGACGNACTSNGTDDLTCANPAAKQCGMTCEGENYDVDGNMANGCEKQHPTSPGHDNQHTAVRPQTDCNDGDSQDSFTGTLYSDSRVHQNPQIMPVGTFNATTGSAPDWWSRYDIGNPSIFSPCVDDYNITFTTTGGGNTGCYQLTFITDKTTATTAVINGHSSVNISGGSGSYTDGSTVYFEIQKVCSLPVQEAVTYTVSYHL